MKINLYVRITLLPDPFVAVEPLHWSRELVLDSLINRDSIIFVGGATRTTIKQIADHMGVSSPAVSLALNGRGRLSPETRSRVMAAARELGYRPNASAKAVRTGRFNTIALVLTNAANRSSLIEGYLAGLLKTLTDHEQHLVVAEFPDERFAEGEAAPKMLRESTSDGMIINYIQQIPPAFEEHLKRSGVPCVWTNVRRDLDSVHFDDFNASNKITRHLIGLGHRRIEFVDYVHTLNPVVDHYSTFARYDGYTAAMKEAGLHPVRVSHGRLLSADEMRADAARLLSAPFRPTAIITYGREAYSIYRAAADLGIKVPEHLTIVTFGSNNQLNFGLPIAMAVLPSFEMGRGAAEMLLEKLKTTQSSIASRSLPMELNLTCCAPPA